MNSLRYTNAMLTIIALAFSVVKVGIFIRPTVADSTQNPRRVPQQRRNPRLRRAQPRPHDSRFLDKRAGLTFALYAAGFPQ